jgi:hypothetical protein
MLTGDPHIKVFDVQQWSDAKWKALNLYDPGDFWIVSSAAVHIQGRLVVPLNSKRGNAVVGAIAISGPFVGGSKLIIDPKGSTWNGAPILKEMGSSFTEAIGDDAMNAKLHNDGKPMRNGKGPPTTLDVFLPLNVKLTINRWGGHLDVMITMPAVRGGQDGLCGNFNGNQNDDDLQSVSSRIDYPQVQSGWLAASLFQKAPMISAPTKAINTTDKEECSEDKLNAAMQKCKDAMGEDAAAGLLASCAHDTCNVGDQYVDQYAVVNEELTKETKEVEAKNKIGKECSGWCRFGEDFRKCPMGEGFQARVVDLEACKEQARSHGHLFFSFREPSAESENEPFCLSTLTCDQLNKAELEWKTFEYIP